MFKNYLKIALRNLLKHKTYSFINISGLAVGIACCLLIFAYVQQEIQYDQFHKNKDKIYRISSDLEIGGNVINSGYTPAPAGPALQNDFQEVQRTVRFLKPFSGNPVIKNGDIVFSEDNFFYADKNVFQLFSFEVLQGNPETALADPYSIAITEEVAEKYFGHKNPLGRQLVVDDSLTMQVTALVANLPKNSSIQFDFLCSMATLQTIFPPIMEMWNSTLFNTYFELRPNAKVETVIEKLPAFTEKYVGENKNRMQFAIEPLSDIYLYSDRSTAMGPSGDITYVYIFSAIAAFILLIACINFMNLSTARSSKRAVEIGMRKVLGADRKKLVWQFLIESIMIAVLALLLSGVLLKIFQPAFMSLTNTTLEINPLSNLSLFSSMITITLFVGLLAGSYPALVLSRSGIISIFKDKKGSVASGDSWLRKGLVVLQFTISIALIICTLTVYTQLDFILNKDLGFEKEQIVTIPIASGFQGQRVEAFRTELLKNANIHNVSLSMNLPGMGTFGFDYHLEGKPAEEVVNMSSYLIDEHFMETFGIEMAEGRNFSKEFPSDAADAFIINETAAEKLGWEHPLNKRMSWMQPSGAGYITLKEGRVVGVVKDFHASNLHVPIGPVILQLWGPQQFNVASVRINSTDVENTMAYIEKTWHQFNTDGLFNPNFLDQQFAANYENEAQFGNLFIYFAGLAIFIACLGLLGLASFMAEQRTKEIGIRKVHGARVSQIVNLLSKEFVKLVVVSNLIAWPVAWYAMDGWLQNFAYRIDMSWWIFALAAGIGLLIAQVTVSTQAVRAAVANPIEALRHE